MLSRRSRYTVTTLLVTVPLFLAACAGRSPATEQPDPPSWFVGEEDKTTPAPSPEGEVSLVVGDTAIQPSTLVVRRGEAVRIHNTGTKIHTFTLDGVDMAVMEPGDWTVVSIDLEPGRYAFSSRWDPTITGTLVVR